MADKGRRMAFGADTTSLLADIGGTNTRVALSAGGTVLRDTIRKYANASYPDLGAVIAEFMRATGVTDCAGACVAAAGPVRDGIAVMTNLAWTIDAAVVARATGAETVAVLNDLQAQGHALGRIADDALNPVIAAARTPRPEGTMLVVGVGTGFNAAPVHDVGGTRFVAASECGHVSLPVRTEADLRLLHHLERAHGFPGVEDLLSGRGLERVYGWASLEHGRADERKAADIMAALADGSDATARGAAAIFVRMLGTVVGDLALVHLPFGGIYLIGGVARAFTPHFATLGFAEAFRDKGRFAEFMEQFPVTLIEDDYAALVGCAAYLETLTQAGPGARQS
jgi:glucokinase